jgi:hypothetical protein
MICKTIKIMKIMINIGVKINNGNRRYKLLIDLLIHVLILLKKTYDQLSNIYFYIKILTLLNIEQWYVIKNKNKK